MMAAMPKGYPYVACRGCEKPITDRAELSATGLCADCGPRIQREATLQLVHHSGPYFDHWRARCLAAFGVNLTEHHPDTERMAT
jgi:hypothetical protein